MQQCSIEGCDRPAYTHPLYCLRCLEEIPSSVVQQRTEAYLQAQQMPSGHSNDKARNRAVEMLQAAEKHMTDRARTYDAPHGERSMAKTVAAFNALTGRDLSETEGWIFMAVLKIARAFQGDFRSDNYEDLVAYAALAGESAYLENQANASPAQVDPALSYRVPRNPAHELSLQDLQGRLTHPEA